jgi:hypothetical protein
MFGAFYAFSQELVESGAYVGGEPFQPALAASTVLSNGCEVVVADGPVSDATGEISGVYYLECGEREEAVLWAKHVPTAALGYGSVEVRPCVDFGAGAEGST